MSRFYDADRCAAKADQHWEMAGLARADGDAADAKRHTDEAQLWWRRAKEGGWASGNGEEAFQNGTMPL